MAMPGNKFYPLNDAEYLAVCYRAGGTTASQLAFNPYQLSGTPYVKKNYDLTGCNIRHQHKPESNTNTTGARHIKTVIQMVSKCNLPGDERRDISHPFQKPVKLLRLLIRTYSNPGGFIADGFAGSGSTLIAANMENRPAIGFEIDKKYFDEAAVRLDRELAQGVLF